MFIAKLDMKVVGYDTYIVEKYQGNTSKVKVKITENIKKKHIIVDNSGPIHRIDVKLGPQYS